MRLRLQPEAFVSEPIVMPLPATVSSECSAQDDGGAGFVYVLGSATARGYRTYVGWTLNLERRLDQHNSGKGAKSTRGHLWCLIYAERLPDRIEAMRREWHLKHDRPLRRRLALSAQGIGPDHPM